MYGATRIYLSKLIPAMNVFRLDRLGVSSGGRGSRQRSASALIEASSLKQLWDIRGKFTLKFCAETSPCLGFVSFATVGMVSCEGPWDDPCHRGSRPNPDTPTFFDLQ